MANKLHPIESTAATYFANLAAQIHDEDIALQHTVQRFGFSESEVLRFVRISGLEVSDGSN